MDDEQGDVVALERVVPERADVLDRLFQLYAHDFSELVSLRLEPTGRFAVTVSESWWTQPDHHPFFLRIDGRLAGFALARRGSRVRLDQDVMDVAEFFVVRGERRRGVGVRGAALLLTNFPGRWEVRVRAANRAASSFWSAALPRLASVGPVESSFVADDVDWRLLSLEVRPSTA